MQFCNKCGSLMKVTTDKNKRVLACSCGFVQKKPETSLIKEKINTAAEEVAVVKEDTETLPITTAACPKCTNGKAYYWLQQIRAGDEPETKFLKCTKCKHLWRDNS